MTKETFSGKYQPPAGWGFTDNFWASLQASPDKALADAQRMSPDTNWGLGLAKVTNIDYEELFVSLRTITGVSQMFDRVPVPLTFPGAGARHFLGALPEIGDFCVVGWMPQESQSPNATRTPIILAWVVPGVWPGRDWVTTADFGPDEADLDSPKFKENFKGVFAHVRHKLRHIQPGNIVASSSQGSDLVLDESVILANRRGNEIRLRDQDQAIVMRSLQQFQALSGARVYAGMVQRDARMLPAMCVSDGRLWDDRTQALGGEPIPDTDLGPDPSADAGFYTPAKTFQRRQLGPDAGSLAQSPNGTGSYLDPYMFLQQGGLIDSNGYVQNLSPGTVYGGKQIYRVANQSYMDATVNANAPTLTEYRIEVAHTSDGRLPVTEQTDLFDAERLLSRDPNLDDALSPNTPFIEWVLGSVVGNDPYSAKGQTAYGLPVVPVVFDGDTANPRLEPANFTSDSRGNPPTPLKDQAAMMFRMVPPSPEGVGETWWAVNKQGQFKASIGGDVKGNSVEINIAGGLKIGLGGEYKFLTTGHLEIGSSSANSVALKSEKGPVVIYGGGPLKDSEATVERISGTDGGESDLPSVDIQGKSNIRVMANEKIYLKANVLEAEASSVSITGHDGVDINGTKQVSISADSYLLSTSAQAVESFGGPKYMLPTAYPLHDRTYVCKYPGFAAERATYIMGNREELFLVMGNHSTIMTIGNMIYNTLLGTWQVVATNNSLSVSPAGINGAAVTGAVTLTAAAGAAAVTGVASASLIATGGVATVRGSAGVMLSGPITGPDLGPIICAGSLEPFTNLPFGTWGAGAKAFNVTP